MRPAIMVGVVDEGADLMSRWSALLPGAPRLGGSLIAAYAAPARCYHNLRHLREVLDVADLLTRDQPVPSDGDADPDHGRSGGTPPAVRGDLVRLGAWFHDAVYDVHARDNEERSACWAERALTAAGLPAADVAEVSRLVRLTADHAVAAGDENGSVLCDADLAVLAGPPAAYTEYAAAVRAEFGHVSDDSFRLGRAAVLAQLLALPALYVTRHGRTHWETAARRNIADELASLV